MDGCTPLLPPRENTPDRVSRRRAAVLAQDFEHLLPAIDRVVEAERNGPRLHDLNVEAIAVGNLLRFVPGFRARIELMHRIRKEQFELRGLATQGKTTSAIWAAVLAE